MNYNARTHKSSYDIPVSRQIYYYRMVSKITTFLEYCQSNDMPKNQKWGMAMNANLREDSFHTKYVLKHLCMRIYISYSYIL